MGNYGYGPMMGYGGYGVFHLLWSAFWVVVLILAVVWLMRAMRRHGKDGNDIWRCRNERQSALDILRERYAKGEIDTTEYEERKKTLST